MRNVRILDLKSVAFLVSVILILALPHTALATGRLFIGTDGNGPNGEVAIVNTDCANANIFTGRIISLGFPLNGIGIGPGFLWAGQPGTFGTVPGNTLRILSTAEGSTATPVFTLAAGFPAEFFNEQMAGDPNGVLYHAHWPDMIQSLRLVPPAMAPVSKTFPQADVVGMVSDGTQMWISKWGARQVGTWDPVRNTFTPVFSTPANAGALAWDLACGVLWVGLEGGEVVPYDQKREPARTLFRALRIRN